MKRALFNIETSSLSRRFLALVAACSASAATALAQPAVDAIAPSPPVQVPGMVGIGGPADFERKPMAPLSQTLGVNLVGVPQFELAPIDLAGVLAEDAASTNGRLREGVATPLEAPFAVGMGQFHEVPGGGWLWVLDIHAPNAHGVRVHFADFQLPPGASAIVYDPRIPDNLPAPYVGAGPLGTGDFWAWISWSDTARIEVHLPAELGPAHVNQFFRIDQAIHMYRNPMTGLVGAYGDREMSCHNDLECYPNWVQVGASVGRMSFTIGGSSYACSGAMLSNNSGDLTPYFMTARHCMEDNTGALGSLQVFWFFQRSGCGGTIPAMGTVPRTDRSSYVRTDPGTDMSLVMLDGTVPRTLWWLGNDSASHANGTAKVGIHHPDGSRKRISFGSQLSWPRSCGESGLTSGLEMDFTSGTIEGGSSGSPLLLTNGAFCGVASCGPDPARCPGSGLEGVYGNFFVGYGAFQNYVNNPGQDDGNENNDTCGAATNLNNFFNGTIYSQVVKVYDEDWFRITVPPFGNCTFRTGFNHADGDIDIVLLDGCGGQVASSTSTTNFETVSWTNPGATPREVYLRVYLYNDTRSIYYLEFSRASGTGPANDSCSSATVFAAENGNFAVGTTNGANTDGAATCATGNADVWFRFSVDCTRRVLLTTELSNYDTVMSIHTGCPGTGSNQVACNDDRVPGITYSWVDFTATGGQTYYARIAGYNGAFGTYQLNCYLFYASNDVCVNAADLAPGSYGFDNCPCATDGPPDDVCAAWGSNQIYRDFWHAYTPTCDGLLELNTVGSNFDTKVAIYANANNASCPPGPNSAIACNDDISSGDLQSRVVVAARAGQRYILRIGSYNASVGRAGVINLLFTPLPSNNDCPAAREVSEGSYTFCTTGATTDGPDEPTTCAFFNYTQVGNDTWLRYTSSCQGQVTADLCGSGFDTKVAVYSGGSCPTQPGTAVACNDDACGTNGWRSRVTFPSNSPGEVFLIRVGGYQGQTGSAVISITCEPNTCTPDFNGDGDIGTDQDIEAFFACLGGNCCATCGTADFNGDGDFGTDQDIESFFRVLAGGPC